MKGLERNRQLSKEVSLKTKDLDSNILISLQINDKMKLGLDNALKAKEERRAKMLSGELDPATIAKQANIAL